MARILSYLSTGMAVSGLLSSCAGGLAGAGWNPGKDYGQLADPRDGQVYRTISVGEHRWMAQNLAFASSGSWCYDNSPAQCTRYGRLYSPLAAGHACPRGWHLATGSEWRDLLDRAGGAGAATRLIATGGWEFQGGWWDRFHPLRWIRPLGAENVRTVAWVATDSLGLRILPGGFRSPAEGAGKQAFAQMKVPWGSEKTTGLFSEVGKRAHFWAATDFDELLDWNGDPGLGISIVSDGPVFGQHAFAVRCVETSPSGN